MSLYDVHKKEIHLFDTVKDKLIDMSKSVNTGYSGTNQSLYGSNKTLYGDLIDVTQDKTLYYKIPITNKVASTLCVFGCYDSDGNFLYLSSNSDTISNNEVSHSYNLDGLGVLDDGTTYYSIAYNEITFNDETAFAQLTDIRANGSYASYTDNLFVIGREPISSLTETWDEYCTDVNENFEKNVKKVIDNADTKTGVFVGDSLTNWGGGTDEVSGFLKVVHEKTGLITKNEGYAGAWWQTGDDQTYCAVNRVNTIVSEGRKYDLYCFIMGTNAGSNTDTGETSADTTTMSGAIRYCMETLKAYHPTARILVCLPPQRVEGNENQAQVNEVIKSIAESYSVKTLDLYHHSGVVPNTVVSDSNYLSDGLHLGENGYTVIGDTLAAEIKYLLCL